MKFSVLIFLFFCSSFTILAQERSKTVKSVAKMSVVDFKSDLQSLYQSLVIAHPNVYQYTERDSFESWIVQELSLFKSDSISNARAYLSVSRLVSKVGCTHTYVIRSLRKEGYTQPPVTLIPTSDGVVIYGLPKQDSLFRAGVVTHVNGLPTESVVEQIKTVRTSDGVGQSFQTRYAVENFFMMYQVLFGAVQTWQLTTVCLDDSTRILQLPGQTILVDSLSKAELKARKEQIKQLWTPPKAGKKVVMKKKEAAELYFSKQDTTVAVLRISTFSYKGYTKFYRKVFKYLRKNNVLHLVVDVRGNLGGAVSNVGVLTSYLVERPYSWHIKAHNNRKTPITADKKIRFFIYNKVPYLGRRTIKTPTETYYSMFFSPQKDNRMFRPQTLHVLHNAYSVSGGSIAASVLKDKAGAVAIGSETGGGAYSLNALIAQNFELPHSKMRVVVAGYGIKVDLGKTDSGRGVQPDFLAVPGRNDIAKGRDVALQQALSLIAQSRKKDK
jgi:hypothetical protein